MAWKKSPPELVSIICPERLLADDGQARAWVERARSHVATMRPKAKKKGATGKR